MRKKKRREHHKLKDNSAFTLLEVLIAIVILSIGLLGMASLTVGIIKGNSFSNELTTATTLAQDKMEDIRRIGSSDYSNVVPEAKAICPTPYDHFKREVLVADDSPATGMKTVVVKVYWGELRWKTMMLN
ncbi:MAG: prepilin-type N-terminal cleavage/methylation domain-containing protein [Deltaproteobacteria bacterium]|nr:prepilin-type N-terminal cleavage/methylation domain-containing protein [Deltaproteobacteria bacterium]